MRGRLIAAAVVLGALCVSSNAFALDAYQDRRGLFAGVGLGGGPGAASVDNVADITGLDDGRQMGLHFNVLVGGGITERLTGAAEASWWIRTVQLGERHLDHQHFSFMPVVSFFLFEGLHLKGGAGLAYASFDAERSGVSVHHYREMGLAAKAGAGWEFFLNGTVAAGVDLTYTRHFYGGANFDTVNGALTLKWY